MAVYERRYRPYEGPLVTGWRRNLVIPRYSYEEAFDSKRFLLFYVACFIPTLIGLLIIFLHNNLRALEIMDINAGDLIAITPRFFQVILTAQGSMAFVLALVLGPTLISSDLAHNALPLYLSRPISRRDYVAGKVLVVFLLMSSATWIASVALFGLEAAFADPAWTSANLWVVPAVVGGGIGWCLLVSVLAVALSAWLKWKPVAAGALAALFMVPTGFAEVVNELFGTHWGYILSPSHATTLVSDALFRRPSSEAVPPAWAAAAMLAALVGAALLLVRRRLHAYEVVT